MKTAGGLVALSMASLMFTTAVDAQTNLRQVVAKGILSSSSILIDLKGDGLDLSGSARTTLVTGRLANVRWTNAQSDDAFIVFDSSGLRQMGWDIRDSSNSQVSGLIFPRDGLRVNWPDEKVTVVRDGWQFLKLLDADKDGRLGEYDSAWVHIKLFTDRNGDGSMSPGEVERLGTRVRSINTAGQAPTNDPFGNRRSDGGFTRSDGTTGLAADVMFSSVG